MRSAETSSLGTGTPKQPQNPPVGHTAGRKRHQGTTAGDDMSERFTISRQRGRWFVAYPDGFLANGGTGGVSCPTFEGAVEAFIRKSEAQCPTCLRGAVIDMPWGWKCEACGNYDIATTWTGPEDAA